MAEQQIISAVTSSSISSFMLPLKRYGVFISFQGEDTRMNFTCHLQEALKQKKVKIYIDYDLKKGDKIKAIEDSNISAVIFSENIASSMSWLEALVKVLECWENQGQIVIRIFYIIDPSDVQKQSGSYKEWKTALTEVANIAGWDSRNR